MEDAAIQSTGNSTKTWSSTASVIGTGLAAVGLLLLVLLIASCLSWRAEHVLQRVLFITT